MEQRCEEKVWGAFSHYNCGNKAKVERNGKWWCGVHDPEKPPTKAQIALQERHKRLDLAWERRGLEATACANLTNAQLKDMAIMNETLKE